MSSILLDYKHHMPLIRFMRGKKTYIVGILMIVLGYLQNDTQLILEGVGLMTLRAGISNSL